MGIISYVMRAALMPSPLEARVRLAAMRAHSRGWAMMPVQLPQDRAPRWLYTLGFDETLGQPELIVFDAPVRLAKLEFQIAFEGLRSGALTLEDGMLWSSDHRARCVARRVHPSQLARSGWLGLAQQRRRAVRGSAEGFEAFQLGWQPALYEPAEAAEAA